MKSPKEKTPLIIRALFLLSLVVFIWSARVAYVQLSLKSWPSTKAKIIQFEPNVVPEHNDVAWYAGPKIKFAYEVLGEKFESAKLNPSPLNYQSPQQLGLDTGDFEKGAVIKCWYNSRIPSIAYAVNRGVTFYIGIIACASGASVIGLGSVIILSKRYWKSQNTRITNQ